MIKLLELLMYGHVHKWATIEKREIYGETWARERGCIGISYTLRCEKCGNIKFTNSQ